MGNKSGGRYGRSTGSSEERPNPWQGAEPEQLLDMVVAITNIGDAVMLSRSSDGGVARLLFFSGDERHKEYAHSADELNQIITEVTSHLRENTE